VYRVNRQAMAIPAGMLLDELKQRIAWKRSVLDERDRAHGPDRVRIGSYMENLALPELFGFDMNDLYSDPRLALETELRHRIFWLDNSPDDGLPNLDLQATVGMYYDMTLFGMDVRHDPDGVPQFMRHPIAGKADLSLVPPFDFHRTGVMPALLRTHERMSEIARREYGGELTIGFPNFNRGPLDVYVQLRGYDNFALDTAERPQFVHDFFDHAVAERARFRSCRREHLREPAPENPTTRIDDDWVNVPFISPDIFRRFVLPAYRRIQANEGTVVGFHTCGNMAPVAEDLLAELPGIRTLDVSGWTDFERLDRILAPDIAFWLSFINTFVLAGTRREHLDMLRRIAGLRRRRQAGLCVQAIVRLHDDFEEDLRRVNGFIALAREICQE